MTMTASAVVEQPRAWRPRCGPTLSPTLIWRSESIPWRASRSPIHDELVSSIWPSRSSVPTARTSQRMAAIVARPVSRRHPDRRDGSARLPAAGTRAAHQRPARRPARGTRSTASLASTAVTGQDGEPDGSCWVERLVAWPAAGRHADPVACRPPLRYTLMTTSRAAMIRPARPRTRRWRTSVNIAPSTSTLSASGSRKAPERVSRAAGPPNRRRRRWRTARTTAPKRRSTPLGWPGIAAEHAAATAACRPTVMALAQLARRPGRPRQSSPSATSRRRRRGRGRARPRSAPRPSSPTTEIMPDLDDAVDLRRLAVGAADAGGVDQHLDGAPDQGVARDGP